MLAAETCRICSGALTLLHPGAAPEAGSDGFAPSCHRPGAHGDLYRCRECGTVAQPSLPSGADLHALYHDMQDAAYLAEEAGRRRTSGRLLDLVEGQVPGGRLLEVGCGHGLLLDEARRRGFSVRGLELSTSAADYATGVLGLPVDRVPLEDPSLDDTRWDAIVMADVLEHLDDPVGALERCASLLAPGGALLVVTPDPSSLTARLAGSRWWGYLPAHTYLVPRLTLRELVCGQGLVMCADKSFVRTFSLRYWIDGFAERGGTIGRALRAVAARVPRRLRLSLSLGDERVVLARRVEVAQPADPLVTPRGGPVSVHVVLPAYKAERTIGTVAEHLPVAAADRALLVDDASPDDTSRVALHHGFEVLRHPANRGYGGNQKTCYVRAALDGADVIVMVHADNQYDPALVELMVQPIIEGDADVVMGSRLLDDKAIAGGMPRWKWLGNRFLTTIENVSLRRDYSEYHTGYRAYSVDFLRTVPFLRNDDGFVFDQEIFAQIVSRGARVHEVAIPTRYFLEASSVSFSRSVEYGLRTLVVLARFRLDERRGAWALLRRPSVALRAAEERVGAAR